MKIQNDSEFKKGRKEAKKIDGYVYCKYCGAKLKKDFVGKFCPTKNCQWQYADYLKLRAMVKKNGIEF